MGGSGGSPGKSEGQDLVRHVVASKQSGVCLAVHAVVRVMKTAVTGHNEANSVVALIAGGAVPLSTRRNPRRRSNSTAVVVNTQTRAAPWAAAASMAP